MMDDQGQMFAQFLRLVRGMLDQDPAQWAPNLQDAFRDFTGANEQEMTREERAAAVREFVRAWEGIVADFQNGGMHAALGGAAGVGGGAGAMPGAFPP
jgi:hypothetical protein